MRRSALIAALAALSCLAAASDPAEQLPDSGQEARARAMFKTLRCVVCQNESIDESNADLAADQRRIVRRQIAQGRSDAEIRTFMTDRYGEFVLLKPPFNPGNALLWLTPVLILGAGGAYLAAQSARPRAEQDGLSKDEASALKRLLAQDTLPPHKGSNNGLDET